MFAELPSLEFKPARNSALPLMLALFLIMLVFFVMLNSFSRPVEEKEAAALYGLQEGFDYRIDTSREGEILASKAGPAWFEDVESRVKNLVAREWPGAKVTSSAELGVVDVQLALGDTWGEEAWNDAFIALVQNLREVLQDVPAVFVRVGVESSVNEGVAAKITAFSEQLPEVSMGWSKPEGATVDVVRLVVSDVKPMPKELMGGTLKGLPGAKDAR